MNTIGAIGLAFFGAWLIYLLVRIAHNIHSDRQTAKFIKERDAQREQSEKRSGEDGK